MGQSQINLPVKYKFPPDIVYAILPYLDREDIKNLSSTNKYFYNLLDYTNSNTLWHEFYRKEFGDNRTNDEPFISDHSDEFKIFSETILLNRFPHKTWIELYRLRTKNIEFYTWGSLQHARLGFTLTSHGSIPEEYVNTVGLRLKFGINKPIRVPWFLPSYSVSGGLNKIEDEDMAIKDISGGGFSFQILTKAGRLFSTGSTYNSGHKGPGPNEGEQDYNPFNQLISNIEHNYLRILPRRGGLRSPNINYDRGSLTSIPNMVPHHDIYHTLCELEEKTDKFIPGNKHIRRMFVRDSIGLYNDEENFTIDENKLDSIRFVAISSGRSHFLALDSLNQLYSWDSPGVTHGIRLEFNGLPPRSENPILKIGCGWDCSCVYIYGVGLVIWKSRSAIKKGEIVSYPFYKVIPGTGDINGKNRVVDFACCCNNSLFYITNEGDKLWFYSNETVKLLDLKLEGKLSKIEASNISLAIFTDQNSYMLSIKNGEVDTTSLVKLDLDVDERFISLSSGDYHNIALSSKGNIYSWGLESEMCGCLGLGQGKRVVEELHYGRYHDSRSLVVLKPTKIDLGENKVCIAVTAGGWQAGALVITC